MKSMTIPELYELLNSPRFRKPEEGDLFYNFYIYQYPAEKEYEMRAQIEEFQKNLIRPTMYCPSIYSKSFAIFSTKRSSCVILQC